MTRLIDLDKAISAIQSDKIHIDSGLLAVGAKPEVYAAVNAACDRHVRMLEGLAEDATELKKGRWVKDRLVSTIGGTYGVRRCSECEAYYLDVGYGWNFCPNCGADMRGGQ